MVRCVFTGLRVLHLVLLKHFHELLLRLVYALSITAVDDLRRYLRCTSRSLYGLSAVRSKGQAKMSPSVFLEIRSLEVCMKSA